MISLILGHKGAGKTKHLISCVNEAVETSKGNVICIEKETKLTYDVNYRARLISTDSFEISLNELVVNLKLNIKKLWVKISLMTLRNN